MTKLNPNREKHYPNLKTNSAYEVKSSETAKYNCIAWALGYDDKWWQPVPIPFLVTYWPSANRNETRANYFSVIQQEGFAQCTDGTPEPGYEKIAIYVDNRGVPKHAAKQLQTDKWSSKLGSWEDIEHSTPEALECAWYGKVTYYFKRKLRNRSQVT